MSLKRVHAADDVFVDAKLAVRSLPWSVTFPKTSSQCTSTSFEHTTRIRPPHASHSLSSVSDSPPRNEQRAEGIGDKATFEQRRLSTAYGTKQPAAGVAGATPDEGKPAGANHGNM